jgi:hypothetical protein
VHQPRHAAGPKRLGQATISITLDTYSHAIPAMQKEEAALIAGLVFAGALKQLHPQEPHAPPCPRPQEG